MHATLYMDNTSNLLGNPSYNIYIYIYLAKQNSKNNSKDEDNIHTPK